MHLRPTRRPIQQRTESTRRRLRVAVPTGVAAALTFLTAGAMQLSAQPPPGPPPGDFYFDNERYVPYAPFHDDQFVDYDDFYYDAYYEDGYYEPYYGPYEKYYEDAEYAYGGSPYGEQYYDDYGLGGYARYGYGYEGFTYDYYDELDPEFDVYDDYYDYGVEESRYYSDDWYEEMAAIERWYD